MNSRERRRLAAAEHNKKRQLEEARLMFSNAEHEAYKNNVDYSVWPKERETVRRVGQRQRNKRFIQTYGIALAASIMMGVHSER